MTRIHDLLADRTTVSFEFFPPKTDAGERHLRETLNELEPLQPSFVSVTYGAGGSTRERTHGIVVDLLERSTMTPMAHLTGYSHTRRELQLILERYRDAGVENILALRGDPPRDDPGAPVGELAYAIELVELAREVGGAQFSIGVAAHPELHPLSASRAEDRRHLATKLSAADFGITQFFFRVADYDRMVAELADLGCETPVIPGIMPVTNVGQIERMAALSGAAFPEEIAQQLHAVEDDPAAVRALGVELATQLCADLLDIGAPGLHFYTLNRSTATREIHAALGLSTARG
ncbi:MAG: methylenetetrahydrofolate reductase [Nitriliruptorales bacterium]|nr:methylenetetrahydrofolate reductase [Nitriliruptorales bacterium]